MHRKGGFLEQGEVEADNTNELESQYQAARKVTSRRRLLTSSGTLSFQDFQNVDIRSGTIIHAEQFPKARKPAYKLRVDFGHELGVRTSSAQLTKLYDPSQLQGRQILAVVNFPPRQIGNFLSQVLVLGVPDANGDVVLIGPEKAVPNGSRVF